MPRPFRAPGPPPLNWPLGLMLGHNYINLDHWLKNASNKASLDLLVHFLIHYSYI